MTTPPPAEFIEAAVGSQTSVVRGVDIFEQDGVTMFLEDAPLISGSVSVDMTRSERRTLDLTLDATDGELVHSAREFWYDKIIKPYRGIVAYDPVTAEPTVWEAQLGEFMIDSIESKNFPKHFKVQCRDKTKKLLNSKFRFATSFGQGQSIVEVIKAIATNGGVTKFILPPFGGSLDVDYVFESGDERWGAIEDIATAFNYEVFFDADGYMVMREFRDPISSPISFAFEFGPLSTVASWSKSSVDTRLHNVIVVKGESSSSVPHTAVAENVSPGSPTSIDEIGERVFSYSSPYITSEDQAQTLADSLLKVHSLEEYTVNFDAIVLPWLEAGEIIKFPDDEVTPDAPTLFLLSSLEIPLGLGPMSLTGKRIVSVI